MGFWDEGLKAAGSSLLIVLGTVLAAPIVLPVLAQITRPVAKAAIRLYLEVADDIQEVVAQHQAAGGKTTGLFRNLLCEGSGRLVAEELETEAEESLAETVLEGVVEIL